MTPLAWIKYAHALPMDDFGTRVYHLTKKACQGQAEVASICILGLSAFSEPATLAEVKRLVEYNITPASFNRLVVNGLADVHNGGVRKWKLNENGLKAAAEIKDGLNKLIAKLTIEAMRGAAESPRRREKTLNYHETN